MSRAALYDATKCMGCRACQVACKQWNELPGRPAANTGTHENPPQLNAYTFTKMRFVEIEDGEDSNGSAKLQCMHCEYPACVDMCIVGALEKRLTGL
jgi:formate dehydrogenase iron-sulfur subunit